MFLLVKWDSISIDRKSPNRLLRQFSLIIIPISSGIRRKKNGPTLERGGKKLILTITYFRNLVHNRGCCLQRAPFFFSTIFIAVGSGRHYPGGTIFLHKLTKIAYLKQWKITSHGTIGDFLDSLSDVVFRACAYRWPSIHRPEVWPCIMKLWGGNGLCNKITSKDFCFTSIINHAGKA